MINSPFSVTEEKMKSTKILIITTLLVASLFLVSCSKSQQTTAPVENTVSTQEPEVISEEPVVATKEPSSVPEDVPVYPDAYDIQVANQNNIVYKANASNADVVAWYQVEFPNYGWDVVKNPDSVVGNMAQISRGNANGDRLALALQYNPVGEFTVVQTNITRAP
jgi:hypothetical protein